MPNQQILPLFFIFFNIRKKKKKDEKLMFISPECKAYEKFAANYADDPFPITKTKMIRYIKFRARCSTFPQYLCHLDQHPLHGPQWLQQMNNDPDIKKLMELTINLWPAGAKRTTKPLIGLSRHTRSESPLSSINLPSPSPPTPPPPLYPQVRVIQGPNSKKGYMVTDKSPHAPTVVTPTVRPSPNPPSRPTVYSPVSPVPSTQKRHTLEFEQISRFRPKEEVSPPKQSKKLKKKNMHHTQWLAKVKQPMVVIERLKSPLQQVTVVIPREVAMIP
ncbi:hypothetical protein BD560DRAFT_393744 [Blakeslea trispora]|nr:hypothetical protein BD560DRAFT_393744 [Blakeslea trispora]